MNGFTNWLSNGTAHWVWKLLPVAFATGVLWMKVESGTDVLQMEVASVQVSVDKLEVRVGTIEGVLMKK